MRFRDVDKPWVSGDDALVALEQLADLLAPHLRPLLAEQPAPADVPAPDWATAPEWAQWWAADLDGKGWWYEKRPMKYEGAGNWITENCTGELYVRDTANRVTVNYDAWRDSLTQRPQVQTTDARLLAADKKREVAERQLADARQEIEALKRERDEARALRDRAQLERSQKATTIANLCVKIAGLSAKLTKAQTERDELAAKWEAIPWEGLRIIFTARQGDWSAAHEDVSAWVYANRPKAQE